MYASAKWRANTHPTLKSRAVIYLDTGMAAKVKIKFSRMTNSHVNGGSGRNISTFPTPVFLVPAEESGVMTLLHDNESDTRLVANFKHGTSFPNCSKFRGQDLEIETKLDIIRITHELLWSDYI